jgi:branched-chain amino acid transport system permease protein
VSVTTATATDIAARRLDLPAMVKEAGITAFVVMALAIGLVGFEVLDVPGGIAINTRFLDVAMVMVIAFVGRVAIILLREHRPLPVLLGTPVAVAVILFLLLSETLFGPETGATIKRFAPFQDPIVLWGILVVTMILGIRSGVRFTHASAGLSPEEREKQMDRIGATVQRATRLLGPLLLAAAIIFPFLPIANRQLLDIGILVVTYIMLGWGLNIVVGLAGLLDLGYVAFYAVGAYSFALLATNLDVSFWVALPFAGLMAATAGVVLGFPVLRLRGDRIILLNWYTFTKGPDGISGIPRPSLFGIAEFKRSSTEGPTFAEMFGLDYSPIQRIIFLYYLILALALVVNLFTMRIRKLPVGRAWEALREDETACRSLGINPRNTKLTAFGIGAMFAGFAGSFFATRQGFISPESFTFIESAVILAIVVLGGFGSQIGVVVAAVLLIGLPEFFRELQQYRMLAFGMAMVLIMIWRPAGLLAHREPTIRLGAGAKGEGGS